jgi:hypothetical protein
MRFVPYQELDARPNVIVDGAACEGTILTLSHWPKSGTPAALKRDTSTEIVFAYLDSPEFQVGGELVSNNHFDEDGLVGIFNLVDPATAQRHRDLLLDVATAGDFGVYRGREAARIVFAISALADPETSPFPAEIFKQPYLKMTGDLYPRLLDILPKLLMNLADFEPLWREQDDRLTLSESLVSSGQIAIEERPGLDLAVVRIPERLPAVQGRFTACHPFAIHNRTACSRILTMQGSRVDFLYRYESWVQLASRRPLLRVDLHDLAGDLNREESSGGRWVFDGVDRITPRLRLEGAAGTSLSPDAIQRRLEDRLSTGPPAWLPYD